VAPEASRLQALLDGLALHAVMRPAKVPPSLIIAVIARHLDALQPARRTRTPRLEPAAASRWQRPAAKP
jgi:BetI-type transcriptional repressor, C-terminal